MFDRRTVTAVTVGAVAGALLNRPAAAEQATPGHRHGHHRGQGTPEPHATEHSPYAANFDPRVTIRSLSPDTIDQIAAGQGAGYALPAELNGVPGPRHVLDLADGLGLTPDQRATVQGVFDEMREAARPAGERFLAAVAALEADFGAGALADADLPARIGEVYLIEGDLAAAHLHAHLRTAALLTADQRAAYHRLRGYEG